MIVGEHNVLVRHLKFEENYPFFVRVFGFGLAAIWLGVY